MSKDRPIHYEPHPVSPARKAELIAAGYRIIDAKFAPKDAAPEAKLADIEKAKAPVGKPLDEKKTGAAAKKTKAKRK